MASNMFMDRDFYYRYYSGEDSNLDLMGNNKNCHWMDEDSPQYPSPHRRSRLSHLLPATTNLGPAFNACATTMTEDDPVLDLDQISSLLCYTGQLQREPNSLSSSMSMSRSRSPYNHCPPVKMEFNEDVLVMDGILLNDSSGDSRSSRTSPFGSSSSTASSGKHYGAGIYRPPHMYRNWKKHQQQPPFLVFGKNKGRTPSPRDEIPSQIAESSAMWAKFSRRNDVNPPASNPVAKQETASSSTAAEATPTTSGSGTSGYDSTPAASSSNAESSTAHNSSHMVTSPSSSSVYMSRPEVKSDAATATSKRNVPGQPETVTEPSETNIVAPMAETPPPAEASKTSAATITTARPIVTGNVVAPLAQPPPAAEASKTSATTATEPPTPTVSPSSGVAPFSGKKKMTGSAPETKVVDGAKITTDTGATFDGPSVARAKSPVKEKSGAGAVKTPTPSEVAEAIGDIEPYLLLQEEEKNKGKERVYRENVPAISKRLLVFESFCHSQL